MALSQIAHNGIEKEENGGPAKKRRMNNLPTFSSLASRHTILWTVALAGFLVSMSTACVVLLAVLPRLSSPETSVGHKVAAVCLPCIQLCGDENPSRGALADRLDVRMEDSTKMCCAHSEEQLSVLFQLVMRRRQEMMVPPDPKNGSDYRFSPVSAHKLLQPENKMYDVNGPKFIREGRSHLTFNPVSSLFHYEHARNVNVYKKCMEIVYPGLYFIYSSVYFRPSSSLPCKSFDYQTWGQFVTRYSTNHPEESGTILRSVHTCCLDCSFDHHSSYSAGVFHLHAGDKLYVEVSGWGLVRFDPRVSYFGLMMLASPLGAESPSGGRGDHTGTASSRSYT